MSPLGKIAFVLATLASLTMAYRPLRPTYIEQRPAQGPVGDPLYLTPLIQAGQLDEARAAALNTDPLVDINNQQESYSGFLTVDAAKDHNMFFWFYPAQEDAANAPVVIWLQGGPGGSSMFGLLELHGPYLAIQGGANGVTIRENPYSWNRVANVLYIDNPVGAGFSYSDPQKLPTTQAEVAADLYEALIQWYTLFSEYQGNEFYAFGESYGGKWVPTIARKIDQENPNAAIKINLAGIGVGDGFMSPPDSAVYGDYLYQAGLVDDVLRKDLLDRENKMKDYVARGDYFSAWLEWNNEFGAFLDAMGCGDYYEITRCDPDSNDNDYANYVQLDQNRLALHVGDRPFGEQSGDIYNSMLDDFMKSQKEDMEYLLDRYKVLVYDGNLDVICNHAGILNMFNAMKTWSGIGEYNTTSKDPVTKNGETIGYLKSVQNLRLFLMRNAGHMVPKNQPEYAFDMFRDFLDGSL